MEPALNLLVAHGFIREKETQEGKGPGRKPSTRYEVNPLLPNESTFGPYSQNSHYSQNSPVEEIEPTRLSGNSAKTAVRFRFPRGFTKDIIQNRLRATRDARVGGSLA
jgi:hypothetical protein